MDADTRDTRPNSYRATIRRHRKALAIPLVLGLLAGGGVAAGAQTTYTATTSLWIDTAPPLPSSASSAGLTLPSEPAAAEQGILQELLTTNTFTDSVAEHSALGSSLGNLAAIRTGALAALDSGQVVASVAGQQVLKITFTDPDASVATSTLGAIVRELEQYDGALTGQHDAAAVTFDQHQVAVAQSALSGARSALSDYLLRHPGAGQRDPNFQALASAENNATNQLSSANTTLGEATAARSTGGWTIDALDQPTAFANAQGKKKLLEEILAGLLGGAIVSMLVVVALTPSRPESWEDEPLSPGGFHPAPRGPAATPGGTPAWPQFPGRAAVPVPQTPSSAVLARRPHDGRWRAPTANGVATPEHPKRSGSE